MMAATQPPGDRTMDPNGLRQRLSGERPAFGSFVFSSDPAVVEIMGWAGYDFAIVDLEHASLGVAEAVGHIRAGAAAGLAVLVRVPEGDTAAIPPLLDAGAAGIVLPHFGRDPAASIAAARLLRYPPAGTRPTCSGVRAARYGLTALGPVARAADAGLLAVALVEDPEVLADLPALLADAPVDVVLPGAGDLSGGLGRPGELEHPEVRAAVRIVLHAARAANLARAIYVRSAEDFATWREEAPEMVIASIDQRILAQAFAGFLGSLRAPTPAA
jgi:2-keto-3-deoxy-L-rhamnonate aldolase RhmA